MEERWLRGGHAAGQGRLSRDRRPSPAGLVRIGHLLYLALTNLANGRELWTSDGTAAGTQLFQDINTATQDASPNRTAVIGDTIYFAASGAGIGVELWKSDGTSKGTVLVKDIQPGSGASSPTYLRNVGGTLYFTANDGTHGTELWKSDGTEAGTVLVKDLYPGPDSAIDGDFTVAGGTLYIIANDGVSGIELWKSDGTEAGTVLVKDINSGSSGSDLASWGMTDVGGTLFLRANDGVHGTELWKSDGTEVGTMLVKDIRPGSTDGTPNSGRVSMLYNVGGTLLFKAADDDHGAELWRSDGTETGTVLVADINIGPANSLNLSVVTYPPDLPAAVVNGELYFPATDGSHGFELWKSDGTEAGTVLVKDMNPGPANGLFSISGPWPTASFIDVDGTLFYRATDGTHGLELWKSDGTEEGTVLVKDINAGTSSAFSQMDFPMANGNGILYFKADDGVHGGELWKSDGTDEGTVLIRDIVPGMDSSLSQAIWLTPVQDTICFVATDLVHGRELWKAVPPVQVAHVMINDGSAQRSMVTSVSVSFNTDVTIETGAFQLINRDTHEEVVTSFTTSLVGGRTVATLSFLAGPSVEVRASGNSLMDGNYELTIVATKVTHNDEHLDGDGQGGNYVVGEEAVDHFFRFFGDTVGRNRLVNLSDFAAFRSCYGTSNGDALYRWELDFDGNGVINLSDFVQFGARYGKRLNY